MIRTPMRRAVLAGLGLMLAAAIAAAGSPAVAEFLAGLLGTLLVLVALVPVTLVARRLWRTAGERRAARALADIDDQADRDEVRDVPQPVTVAELWESV